MKEYTKPEVKLVKFETENIADIGTGNDADASNEFNDDSFGA